MAKVARNIKATKVAEIKSHCRLPLSNWVIWHKFAEANIKTLKPSWVPYLTKEMTRSIQAW